MENTSHIECPQNEKFCAYPVDIYSIGIVLYISIGTPLQLYPPNFTPTVLFTSLVFHMEKIASCVPTIDERYNHQAKLQDITDAEFDSIFQPPTFTFGQRLYQIFCFLLFLGPIRVVVCGFAFCVCMFLIIVTRVILRYLGFHPDTGKSFCCQLAKIGFRLLFIAFGNVWIKVDGKIDSEARFVISNHVTVIDAMVIFMLRNVTCVVKKHWARTFVMKTLLEIINPIYVEHRHTGRAKEIIDRADDESAFPVLLFPEVCPTNGDVLLQFHKTAFLTPYKVQPMLIRYWMPFVPKGWNTMACVNQSAISYVWQLISMPLVIVSVDVLQSISMEAEGKADIDTFTKNAQILLANHLKIRAISRSSEESKVLHAKKAKKYE